MGAINQITSNQTTLTRATLKSAAAQGSVASSSDSNEDALRLWRNYTKSNTDFTRGFKTVLTTLKSATTTLRQSAVSSETDSSTAEVTYNYDDAIKAAEDFADAYNSTIDYLKKKRNLSGVGDVLKNYKLTSKMKDQLERVGISVDSSGKLTVDKDAMKSALEEDQDVWGDVVTYAKSSLTTRVANKNSYYYNHLDEILKKPALSLTI
jgi:hypothetical protein